MGGVWLARTLRGWRRADGAAAGPAWWRMAGLAVATAMFAVTVAAGGVATAKTFAQSNELQTKPTMFGGVKDAVAAARQAAVPGDLVVIRAGRSTPVWYGTQWLYYMDSYAGYPRAGGSPPPVPAPGPHPPRALAPPLRP